MIARIPEAQRAGVAAAIADAFGDRPITDLAIVRGGLSSALVYRLEIDGAAYLLRVSVRREPLTDPVRHHACLRAAAAAGLAPRVVHTDDDRAIAISEFVAARPLAACPRPVLIEQLGDLTRRLQALPCFPPLVDYLDAVGGLIAQARATEIVPTLDVFARYAELAAAYPRGLDELVASHNDLNPGNLLWDGARLWIVDWEAAFANDRFFDPAYACNYFAIAPADEARFLAAYGAAPLSPRDAARLYLMRQVAHMFLVAMLLQLLHAARPDLRLRAPDLAGPPLAELRPQQGALMLTPAGQAQLAAALLAELDAATRAPRFAAALRLVTS
jgi:hypothetical protein